LGLDPIILHILICHHGFEAAPQPRPQAAGAVDAHRIISNRSNSRAKKKAKKKVATKDAKILELPAAGPLSRVLLLGLRLVLRPAFLSLFWLISRPFPASSSFAGFLSLGSS